MCYIGSMTTSIFSSINNVLNTTKVRTWARAAVAAAVGSVVTYFTTKAGQFHTGYSAVAWPVISSAYYGLVSLAEIKFPKLGWLLGLLPQKKNPTPVVKASKKSAVGSKPVK